MERKKHTAEEIRSEVARLLNEGRMHPIDVPLPLRLEAEAEAEIFAGDSLNWQMPSFKPRQLRGSESAIEEAIMAVQAKWDLR